MPSVQPSGVELSKSFAPMLGELHSEHKALRFLLRGFVEPFKQYVYCYQQVAVMRLLVKLL